MNVEHVLWFVMPLVISMLACIGFKRSSWLSKRRLVLAGAMLGLFGALLAPTAMCNDCASKAAAAVLASSVVSVVVLGFGIGIRYLLHRTKHV